MGLLLPVAGSSGLSLEQAQPFQYVREDGKMALSGEQVKRIHAALLDAYPSEEELRMMVRIELDESLEAVATGKNQRMLIFNLVTWARAHRRADDLALRFKGRTTRLPAISPCKR